MIQDSPVWKAEFDFPTECACAEAVMDVIKAVRSRRAEMNVPPSKKAQLIIATEDSTAFECGKACLQRLCSASAVTVLNAAPENTEGMVSVVTTKTRCFLPLSELVDLDKERERISKELEKNRKFLEGQEKKLSNQNFVSRAPENVVQAERDRAEQLRALIANLEESLKQLG